MKKLFLASVALVALTVGGSALAADMPVKAKRVPPPPPVYSWTGFYVGVNGGYGWGHTPTTSIAALDPASALLINPNFPFLAFSPDQFASSFRQRGGIVGGQIGYN